MRFVCPTNDQLMMEVDDVESGKVYYVLPATGARSLSIHSLTLWQEFARAQGVELPIFDPAFQTDQGL